jgi:putative transposase
VKYDPSKHHRRSIRLRGYDYGQVGAYFVTFCTQDRLCLFGEVENGEMRLNDVGSMVERLKTAIQWFKTMTTNEYIRAVKQRGWPSFPGRLWQRNYYDHIIRNERSLQQIREYIATNPAMWQLDQLHPDNPSK